MKKDKSNGKIVKLVDENKEFRKLIFNLYENFPNGESIEENLKKIIRKGDLIEHLVNSNFLIKNKCTRDKKIENWYSLGSSALHLVSTWKTEELTKKIIRLTHILIVLTVISIFLALIMIFNNDLRRLINLF
jgi:hypothetical protein